MKKILFILAGIAILVLGWFALQRVRAGLSADEELQIEAASRGELKVTVSADGAVRSNQSALLEWQAAGSVEQVNVSLGDPVTKDQVLAALDDTSLSQSIILAQADLVSAQRELDDLLSSQLQSAQRRQQVEQAQQALEDARNPQMLQAEAQRKVAEVQKAVDLAELNYEIIAKPVPQTAIDQARANLLVAERVLKNTDRNIARVNKKLKKDESDYFFFESRDLYKQILEGLENKRRRDQRQYDDALEKYNSLLEPPDPLDLVIAEGNLALKQAELRQALVDLERANNGPTPGEIAVLEAQLADAEREWQRLREGSNPVEIAAAQARVDAAQAALKRSYLSAPFDGVITAVNTQAGDQVSAGSRAFRLDDLSRLLVDARVSEIDINKIQVGQAAILSFDSVPGKQYTGTVLEVPVVGESLLDVVSYKVVVEITEADEQVRPGMTASVEVVVDDLQDVLLVPNRALRIRDGERVVYILKDGEVVPIPLKLGSASDAYTQVLEGSLNPGDQIVLNPPSSSSTSSISE